MKKKMFVVDRNLRAVTINRLLEFRGQLREGGALAPDSTEEADLPVIEGGQELLANTPYPSAKNPSVRFYLPEYRLSADDEGRPAVELRYGEEDGGEVGRLTLSLTWTPPEVSGVELRVMDHRTDLAIRYQVPIQTSDADAPAVENLCEETVPLQPLQQQGGQLTRSTTIFMDKARFDVLYQAMINPDRNTMLEIQIAARVGVRTWKQIVVGQPTEKDQAAAMHRRKALFTHVMNPETLAKVKLADGSNRTKVTMRKPNAERAERVRVLRERVAQPQFVARRAIPAARVVEARPATSARPAPPVAVRASAATPPRVRVRRSRVTARPAAAPAATARPVAIARPVITARVAAHVAPPAAARSATPVTATHARMMTAAVGRRKPRSQELSRVLAPKLSKAVLASDLKIKGRKVVPVQVVLDTERKPAIVDADLDNRQELGFTFDPAEPANRGVFVATEEIGRTIHQLVPLQLTTDDGTIHTAYQDNVMRDVVYVAPSEFRLVRDDDAPFLPSLSFLASDFSTSEADEEAEVLFQVRVVYRLEPWLDPEIHELAREALALQGEVARPTPIVPRASALRFDLDLLGDEQLRAEAIIDPTIGIKDDIELGHDEFVRLWRERLANPSGGVRGQVDFQLYDGSPAQARVEMSFWESSAELFDISFAGPVPGEVGRYRVRARNRIESPVEISELPGEEVDDDVVAHALDQPSLIGRRLQPQEELEIDYQVQPADTAITSLAPTIVGRVEPDLPVLLKELMVTPGYSSLSFSLTVRAAEGVFGSPTAGSEPLTGLLVEFDDGTQVTLTAEDPETEVTLIGRLIGQILGTADDQQKYLYRVTNVYASGEGERTKWEDGQGTGDLEVVAAGGGQLDF